MIDDATLTARLEGHRPELRVHCYRPSGAIEPGLMGFEDPTEAEVERRRRLGGS